MHELYDILTTSDGSDLSSACITQYSDEWDDQVISMTEAVNQALDEGLCEVDTVLVVASSASFASLGSQVKYCSIFFATCSTFSNKSRSLILATDKFICDYSIDLITANMSYFL